MAKILDGKKIARQIEQELKSEVFELKKKGITPGLAVILVGKDTASEIYVRNKEIISKKMGLYSEIYRFDEKISENKVLKIINDLNKKKKIHAILVQLPLPNHINERKIIETISPQKDVDWFHPENIGKLVIGNGMFYSCTPSGILTLLKKYKIKVSGKEAVVVGTSNIVGKPLALMLVNSGATVTICHDKTKNIKEKCLRADILISAVGKAGLIKADMVKQGAVVIDVGINRTANGKLIGDVNFKEVKKNASAITSVPGGIGPMTIAMLMKNTIIAAKIQFYANKN